MNFSALFLITREIIKEKSLSKTQTRSKYAIISICATNELKMIVKDTVTAPETSCLSNTQSVAKSWFQNNFAFIGMINFTGVVHSS